MNKAPNWVPAPMRLPQVEARRGVGPIVTKNVAPARVPVQTRAPSLRSGLVVPLTKERARGAPRSGPVTRGVVSEAVAERVKQVKPAAHESASMRSDNIPRDKQTCKERPNANKRKSGGGGSRAFVPWCKRT